MEQEDKELLLKDLCARFVYMTTLEKFKSLQHINGDGSATCEDWGYTPSLYHFDGAWHVGWIHCEDGDEKYGFSAESIEEVVDKAYDWFHSTFCNG